MKIINKLSRTIFVCCFVTLLTINFTVVTISDFDGVGLKDIMNIAMAQIEIPYLYGPGKVGKTEACRLDLGGGWFTSSVKYACYDNYVCPSCTCTPHACGEEF